VRGRGGSRLRRDALGRSDPHCVDPVEGEQHIACLTRQLTKSRHIIARPRGRAVRVSFHYYNVSEDVVALLEALDEWRHMRR
jgi:selenocysteine lyase/cysteine desulfurase